MARYVLLIEAVPAWQKRWGKRFSEVLPGSPEPGIRGTPSSGSRVIFFFFSFFSFH